MLSQNAWLKGLVRSALGIAPGTTEVAAQFNSTNEMLVSQGRGQYAELCRLGKVFSTSVAAVTLPVNAATLASKFGLYNPPQSGVNLELIDAEAHFVVATTVVDALGLYYSQGSNATGATFTTAMNIENGLVGAGAGKALAYSAVTHVGTPVLLDMLGGWGAVTDGGSGPSARKDWNGKIIVPPGTLLALAMTTAASTASGITAVMRWAEIPVA